MLKVHRGQVTNPRKGCSYVYVPEDASPRVKSSVGTSAIAKGGVPVDCDAKGTLYELAPAAAKKAEAGRATRAEMTSVTAQLARNRAVAAKRIVDVSRAAVVQPRPPKAKVDVSPTTESRQTKQEEVSDG